MNFFIKKSMLFPVRIEKYLIISVAFVVLLLGLMRVAYLYERQLLIEGIMAQHSFNFEPLNEVIRLHCDEFLEYAEIISNLPSLVEYAADADELNQARLIADFRAFSIGFKGLDRIRFIGSDGTERICVVAQGTVIDPVDLQNESDRYYFKQGMLQPLGTLHVSPIDLNVAGGVIELPYRPVMRVVVPVANSQGDRVGIVVLHFDIRRLFRALKKISFNKLWNFELLNKEGYWLIHENQEQCLGFMFSEGQQFKIPIQDPELWARIIAVDSGCWVQEQSVFQWLSFSPLSLADSSVRVSESESIWRILVQVNEHALAQFLAPLVRRYLLFSVLLVMSFGFAGILQIFRVRHSRELEAIRLFHSNLLISAEVVVIAVNADGVIQFLNPAAEKFTGWAAAEVVGKKSHLILHDQSELQERAQQLSSRLGRDVAANMELFAAATETFGRYVEEWMYTKKDGSKLPVLLTFSAIENAQGKAENYLGVAVDLTPQKQVQYALIDANIEAEHLVQMKSQFLANMSHEIRTPMNGIVGLSNLLLNSKMDKSQAYLAQNLVLSAEVLMTVLNDILDFSKVESGSVDLEFVPFEMNLVIEHVLILFTPQAEEKNIKLIERTNLMWCHCFVGDAHRITQVISNLLSNAVKFTQQGEVVLAVAATDAGDGNARVRFEIKDSGIGMSPAVQEQIFGAFCQADSSTTRRFGGTGLGVTISSNLVAIMGGELGVESQEGEGSTFWFELVLSCAPELPQGDSSDNWGAYFCGRRALIVDDDQNNLLVLQRQLEQGGFAVNTFNDPKDAYQSFKNDSQYDLIILDYLMPDLNGLELAEQLKPYRKGEDSKLMILSSADVLMDAAERSRLGIQDFLTKTITPHLLFRRLSEWFASNAPTALKLTGSDSAESEASASAAATAASAAATAVSAGATAAAGSDFALRIIVADDEPINQMVLRLQLKQMGYDTVAMVANGRELLQHLDEDPYDLVFLDCNMPVMDGYEVAREIRAREARGEFTASGRRIWLVAASAYAFASEKEKARAAGMDEYLPKPLRVKDIKRVLDEAPRSF